MSFFNFVKRIIQHKLLGALSPTKRGPKNIKDLRRVLDDNKLAIEAVGEHDPRRVAILLSKNIAVSWIFYNSQGRRDTEIRVLDCLTDLGRRAILHWRVMVMTVHGLGGVDGMIYHALCLILVEAYLERSLKTSQDAVFWMDQALELYTRVLQDDPGGILRDEDPAAAERWQTLDADDFEFSYDDTTTTGGCVSKEARKTNLDMARLIHAEEFARLRVRDVRKEVRDGSGTIRLKSDEVLL